MHISDFDFELPQALIAQFPTRERSGSRLLCLDGNSGALNDQRFHQLPELLDPRDLLVFNDTRVIKARLFGQKPSGGKIEVLVERILDMQGCLAQIRASHAPKPGSRLELADGAIQATVIARQDTLYHLVIDAGDWLALLEAHGALPLPPYIQHAASVADEARYQTVYARHPGAVAAPTAGLHFDETVLAALRQRGIQTAFVTLHVGAGTFQPVRSEEIHQHKMHSEWFHIPPETAELIRKTQAAGGKITAVGTTALRALESAARDGTVKPGGGETDIFITPGYRFQVVERLLTNFHLPRTTLIMLVSAFAGIDSIQHAYQHAIREKYRFFSYGDAMLIARKD